MAYNIMLVGSKIKQDLAKSGIVIPKNYALDNAIKSAFLSMINSKQPVLKTCTEDSIKNALLDMIIQGLNPAKKQCSFIPRGNILTLHRDYFGSIMLAKKVQPKIMDIRAGVIYSGDAYKIRAIDGLMSIEHEPEFKSEDIELAYAVAVDNDNNTIYSDVMRFSEVNAAWNKSRNKSIHKEFPGEMAQKTVAKRLCKKIINTSDDEQLLSAVAGSDEDRHVEIDADFVHEIQGLAPEENTKMLDFPEENEPENPVQAAEEIVSESELKGKVVESSFSAIENEINSVQKSKPGWA